MSTAKQFFEQDVPGFLGQEAAAAVGGVVEFVIEGDEGGTWYVDFTEGKVATGAAPPRLTAIVRAHARDFMALIGGHMSPSDGLLTERLHVAGEAVSIGRLMHALTALAAKPA